MTSSSAGAGDGRRRRRRRRGGWRSRPWRPREPRVGARGGHPRRQWPARALAAQAAAHRPRSGDARPQISVVGRADRRRRRRRRRRAGRAGRQQERQRGSAEPSVAATGRGVGAHLELARRPARRRPRRAQLPPPASVHAGQLAVAHPRAAALAGEGAHVRPGPGPAPVQLEDALLQAAPPRGRGCAPLRSGVAFPHARGRGGRGGLTAVADPSAGGAVAQTPAGHLRPLQVRPHPGAVRAFAA